MPRHFSPSRLALASLVGLWALFFWRVWTPISAEQVSFAEGDFSAQFVAWTAYALTRLEDGQLPQWNPHQYGGAPFQASSQTALFYPPRWATLGLLLAQNEVLPWEVYALLQMEVLAHVLLAGLLTFGFMRWFLREQLAEQAEVEGRAVWGAWVAAVTYSYGGYVAGYPILQAPLLYAGVWWGAVLWALGRATPPTSSLRWPFIAVSGGFIGLSLLAGHPQTAWFLILLALAWLVWRWRAGFGRYVLAVVLMGGVAGVLSAVQLLPTAEFTAQTARLDLTFAQKGGGYSFEEVANLLFPLRGTLWNSNFFGLLPLILSLAMLGRGGVGRFFAGLGLFAFVLSFGARTPLYGLLYPLLPLLSLFRGQERAVYLLAVAVSVLAGMGVVMAEGRVLRRITLTLGALAGVYGLVLYFIAQGGGRNAALQGRLDSAALSVMILGAAYFAWERERFSRLRTYVTVMASLLIFDLFSATFMLAQNYEAIPVHTRLAPVPALLTLGAHGERVDSAGVAREGYAGLLGLFDVRGSDPLQLAGVRGLLEDIPAPRLWEVLAVQAVASREPPPVPFTEIGRAGEFGLYRLDDPRPFAHLVTAVTAVRTDEEAYGLLREPAFDPRQIALVQDYPTGRLNGTADAGQARIMGLAWDSPEQLNLRLTSPAPALLTLALPHYSAWRVQVNGESARLWRAYGGLSAVDVPAGASRVVLHYDSRFFTLGAGLSAGGGLLYGVWLVWMFIQGRRKG